MEGALPLMPPRPIDSTGTQKMLPAQMPNVTRVEHARLWLDQNVIFIESEFNEPTWTRRQIGEQLQCCSATRRDKKKVTERVEYTHKSTLAHAHSELSKFIFDVMSTTTNGRRGEINKTCRLIISSMPLYVQIQC